MNFPKQLLAKARGSKRRTLAIALILIAVVAALYYVFGGPAAQQRRANRFGTEGPVPVLVAPPPRAQTCRSISTLSAPSRRSTP